MGYFQISSGIGITKPEVSLFKYLEHYLWDITLMSSTDMFRLLPGLDLGREWSV